MNENSEKPTVPATVLETALQELGFLWQQWREAIHAADFGLNDIRELESRIRGYQDMALTAGKSALPELEHFLTSGEPETCFAAAWVLLALKTPQAARIMLATLNEASGDADILNAVRDAFCYAQVDTIADDLRAMLRAEDPLLAITAAEILAFHDLLAADDERVVELLGHESPEVRIAAWRVIAFNEYLPQASSTYAYD